MNVHRHLVLKVIVAYGCLQIIHSGYLLICCIWILFYIFFPTKESSFERTFISKVGNYLVNINQHV